MFDRDERLGPWPSQVTLQEPWLKGREVSLGPVGRPLPSLRRLGLHRLISTNGPGREGNLDKK